MSTPPRRNRNAERGESTRARLVATATELFAERGYEATSVEQVLARAGVSKGSLYHHFASKDALFEAVLDAVEAGVAQKTMRAARGIDDPVEALRAACRAWLRLARDKTVRQIVLIDAPAAMGWERWREIDERHSFGILKQAVAQTPGGRDPAAAEVLSHVLLAAVIEIAMVIARSRRPRRALASGEATLDRLLAALAEPAGDAP
jgi:AcrR family transcriptional regulator